MDTSIKVKTITIWKFLTKKLFYELYKINKNILNCSTSIYPIYFLIFRRFFLKIIKIFSFLFWNNPKWFFFFFVSLDRTNPSYYFVIMFSFFTNNKNCCHELMYIWVNFFIITNNDGNNFIFIWKERSLEVIVSNSSSPLGYLSLLTH